MNNQKAVGLGLGVAAVAALAGAYFLYGTEEGKKRRHKIESWALKVKADVLHKIENLKEINEGAYNKAVDEVVDQYKTFKNVDMTELLALGGSLKKHWTDIRSELETTMKTAKSSLKTKKPAAQKSKVTAKKKGTKN